jgi:hypothetical protein
MPRLRAGASHASASGPRGQAAGFAGRLLQLVVVDSERSEITRNGHAGKFQRLFGGISSRDVMLYSDLRQRASTRPLCVRKLVVGLQCNSLFCITANYELEGLSRHALAFRTYMLRNIGLAALPDRAATGAIGAFASLRAHARCLAAVRRARVALPMSSAAERRLLSAALSLRRRAPQVRAHHEPEVVARSARRGEPRGGPRATVPAAAVPAAALLGVCLVDPQAVGWAAGQTSRALGGAATGSAHSQIGTSPAHEPRALCCCNSPAHAMRKAQRAAAARAGCSSWARGLSGIRPFSEPSSGGL